MIHLIINYCPYWAHLAVWQDCGINSLRNYRPLLSSLLSASSDKCTSFYICIPIWNSLLLTIFTLGSGWENQCDRSLITLPNAALEGAQTQLWRTWQKICVGQTKLENTLSSERQTQSLCDQLGSFLNGVWWATDFLLELSVHSSHGIPQYQRLFSETIALSYISSFLLLRP